jgi:uncharacterized protein (TIGR02466 family)
MEVWQSLAYCTCLENRRSEMVREFESHRFRHINITMNINKNEWWATPVWEIESGFDEYFNLALAAELADIKLEKGYDRYDIWDYKTPRLLELKEFMFDALDQTVPEYFGEYYPYNPCFINGWANIQHPGADLPLHDHGGTVLVSTYYVTCEENSGDLLVVDPRMGANWEWIADNGFQGVKYRRITPKAGKFILFPGYVMHMVETNRSNSTRISIATNIHNGRIDKIHTR